MYLSLDTLNYVSFRHVLEFILNNFCINVLQTKLSFVHVENMFVKYAIPRPFYRFAKNICLCS